MTTLFQRIKQWREKNNITVSAIEIGASLTTGSLKKWKNSMPSGEKILRVANFFGVSVDYLLGNSENPYSHKTEPVYDPADFVASLEDIRAVVDQKIAETKNQMKAADETEVSNTADIDEK